MLAERARLPLAMLAAASLVTAIAVARRAEPRQPAPPATSIVQITDFCPPHVRAAIHLGADARLYCVRGQFPEPGTFVFAQYRTSEPWERFAVVGDDGNLLVPMLDRPGL